VSLPAVAQGDAAGLGFESLKPRAQLRCHCCSMWLTEVAMGMHLVAIFKASRYGFLGPTHPQEVRLRCRRCGWVNIFHPLTAERHLRTVETK